MRFVNPMAAVIGLALCIAIPIQNDQIVINGW